MIPEVNMLSQNFYFPKFGSYFSFELHLETCDPVVYRKWKFNIRYTQCKRPEKDSNTEKQNDDLNFYVRSVFDDNTVLFNFCKNQEFCTIERFLEFLETNSYYTANKPDLNNIKAANLKKNK